MYQEKVYTDKAPKVIGPYSQAIVVDETVYTSGQIPLTSDGVLIDGGIEEQTQQVFKNIRAVLHAAGSDLNHVVKTTVFLSDLQHFDAMNRIYADAFQDHRPARSCVEVSRLPKDVLVEIEVIAKKK